MKPDEIPDDLDPSEQLRAINVQLSQLHQCMDGRLDSVEGVIRELVIAKAEERKRTVEEVQEERHRAKNAETHLQAQLSHMNKSVKALAGIPADLQLLKDKLGADKPTATVAGMSQRKLAIWAGSIAALAAAGPTIVREIAVLGHGAASVFVSIGAIR